MKRLLSILPLLFGFLTLLAQYDIVEKQYPVNEVKAATVGPNGYYLLRYDSEKRKEGQYLTNYKTPELVHVNANMEVQWRRKFPESKFETLSYILSDGQTIYLSGTRYAADQEVCFGWVIAFDAQGNEKWSKNYAYPSYHSIEGRQLLEAPNGDLIFSGHAYRNYNSMGSPILFRVQKSGALVWKKLYGTNYSLPHFNYGSFTPSGEMLFGGHVYPDNQALRVASSPKAWAVKIDFESGALIWDHYFKVGKQAFLAGVMEGENGNLVALGHSDDNALKIELSQSGELRNTEMEGNCEKNQFNFIALDQSSDYAFAAGRCTDGSYKTEHVQTVLAIFDADMKEIDRLTIDANTTTGLQKTESALYIFGHQSMLVMKD